MKLEDVKNDKEVNVLVDNTERQLTELGYTEHGRRHIGIVSEIAGNILEELGYSEREIELARIAGYLHDIGKYIFLVYLEFSKLSTI